MAINAGDAVIKLGLDTKKFDSDLKGVSGRLDRASQKWGRKMKIAGGIMIAAVAAIGAASLKMAADFDSAMRSVNTMMLLSEEAFGAFRDEVQALARDMGVSAVDSANALYQAISAGVPRENVLEFLRIATEAAIGGITDTKTAVDGLTTVINAFKIPISDAQHVADVMFTTVKGGKTTFEELSASMFNVAPIAAAAGVSFEEVSAALASITKQGVPTAVATTQLRAAIQAIAAPTIRQKKMMIELGLELSAETFKTLGLAGAFNLLTEATGGNMEMMRKLVGSVEGVQAILALTGQNAETFTADLEAMANAEGAATDAFEQMEKSMTRQMARLKAQLQDVGITIGFALMPALIKILNTITPLITKFGEWAASHTTLVVAILASVAALGALLLVGGILLPLLSTAIASIHLVAAAQWAWNVAMAANPIGLLVYAIAGLIAGIVLIAKKWKSTTKTVKEQLEEQTRLVGEHVTEQRQIQNDAFNERMAELWEERQASLAIIDAMTAAQIAPLQEELDAIDRFWKDKRDIEEEARLIEAGDEEALAEFYDRLRQDQLRDDIDAIRETGKESTDVINLQYDTMETEAKDWAEEEAARLEGIKARWDALIQVQADYMSYQRPANIFGFAVGGPLLPGEQVSPFERLTPEQLESLRGGGNLTVPQLGGGGLTSGPSGSNITNTFNISQLVVREEADVERIAISLERRQRISGRQAGVA